MKKSSKIKKNEAQNLVEETKMIRCKRDRIIKRRIMELTYVDREERGDIEHDGN